MVMNAIVLSACCTCIVASAEQMTVTDLKIVEPTSASIGVGSPLSILLQVQCITDLNADPLALNYAVATTLSQRVDMNDTSYRNRLSSGSFNELARFEVVETATTCSPLNGKQKTCTVELIAHLFLNFHEASFVFRNSGKHQITFRAGSISATIDVQVSATDAGSALLNQLEQPEILQFLADMPSYTNTSASADLVNKLKEIYENAEDAPLRRIVKTATGIALLSRCKQEQLENTRPREEYLECAWAAKPYFGGEISDVKTEIDAMEAWGVAMMSLIAVDLGKTDSRSQEIAKYELACQRIVDSTYSGRVRVRGKVSGHLTERLKKKLGN